jgi:hypothetical protein
MKTITRRVGIWDAKYRLIAHRDGRVTIRAPFVAWNGNTGSLAFCKIKFLAGLWADEAVRYFNGCSDHELGEILDHAGR